MTIARETMGEGTVWIACCDECGDRHELDIDGDDEKDVALAELAERGWQIDPPEKVKFNAGHDGTYREEYEHHVCRDCQ